MDNKALFKMSYGVFMLSTKSGGKTNGCIINTGMQVANSPTRIAISVLNTNYTCDLLKESGLFTLSILDQTVKYSTFQHWGLQSGRDVNKLQDLNLPEDLNGIPYLSENTCAVISCKVVDKIDLGTHTMFIGEVVDAFSTSDNAPLTYSEYHSKIKPKPESTAPKNQKKIVGWRCKICFYIYEGPELPEDFVCPMCGHPREDFEPIYED